MPRPGPRPYECVRRAWHSDRHQPMRASLVQQLYRMANQVHSPSTRKNLEWQEKLPFVILKAEEIIYSKANSETEYMDENTLWERANEAIDTIIRKDESTETGVLLYPCIEAALILGCTPRRASRSQRYSNPGCYLSANEPHTNIPISNSNQVTNQVPILINPNPPSNPNSTVNHDSSFLIGRNYPDFCRVPLNNQEEQSMGTKVWLSCEPRECDLSLRLGISSPTWFGGPGPLDSSCSEELEDAGSTSSYV